MDVAAIAQLVSNLGIALALALGFLYVAREFVSKTMPTIAATNAKTIADARAEHLADVAATRQQFVTALADQRKDLLALIGEQREEVNRVLTAIVSRLEKIDADVMAVRKVVEHKS